MQFLEESSMLWFNLIITKKGVSMEIFEILVGVSILYQGWLLYLIFGEK
jgi:hypothetical protein